MAIGVTRPSVDSHSRRCSDSRRPTRKLPSDWRSALPYGTYTTSGGALVLFNRRYAPLFRRDRDGVVHRDDPARWIADIKRKAWFYDDSCSPRANRETLRRVLVIEDRWQTAAGSWHPADLAWLAPPAWITNVKLAERAA